MKMKLIIFFIVLYFTFNFCICNKIIRNNDATSDTDFQCRQFDFETKLNISVGKNITVVYNSSLCKKCLQKLLLFKALKTRFDLAGFNELNFIMLTTEYSGTSQFEDLQNKSGKIQVISLHEISNEFFIPKSFYVFDKCSRLTYELTPPFNVIQNQVVKAAILSTWFDMPCGNCNTESSEDTYYGEDNDIDSVEEEISTDYINTSTMSSNLVEESAVILKFLEMKHLEQHEADITNDENTNSNKDSSYIIPLKVIIPSEHVHPVVTENSTDTTSSYVKYNFFILSSNDSSYHEHFSQDKTELLRQDTSKTNSEDDLNSTEKLTEDENMISSQLQMKLIAEDGARFEIARNYSTYSENGEKLQYQEISPVRLPVTIITPPLIDDDSEKERKSDGKNSSVFSALHPWLSFSLKQGSK